MTGRMDFESAISVHPTTRPSSNHEWTRENIISLSIDEMSPFLLPRSSPT